MVKMAKILCYMYHHNFKNYQCNAPNPTEHTVHFKGANCVVCELYSTRLFQKSKDNIHIAHQPEIWAGWPICTPGINGAASRWGCSHLQSPLLTGLEADALLALGWGVAGTLTCGLPRGCLASAWCGGGSLRGRARQELSLC